MTRLVFPVALAALLLAAPISAFAQTASDNETTWTVPGDGLFSVPKPAADAREIGWDHTLIAWWWLVPMAFIASGGLWFVSWMDADARRVHIEPVPWNAAGLGIALAALLLFVLLPAWLSLPLAAAGFITLAWKYIPARNAKVLPTRQLLTREHREALKTRLMARFGVRPAGTAKRLEKIAREHVPVALYDATGRLVAAAEAPFEDGDPIAVVRVLIGEAGKRHAREIQLEPKGGRIVASFVIDGFLYAGPQIERLQGGAAMTAVKKVLADPASATPQFRVQLPLLEKGFSVTVFAYGEGDAEWMRLRLKPDGEETLKFDQLGLAEAQAATVRAALESGRGLIAVASPAGGGSRTTICAMLDSLDPFSRNIVTFERPIAGRLASIERHEYSQPSELAGLLREALLKEPELVMLSEAPDAGVAELALASGERGRAFLVRFEARDAASVPGILIAMGVTPASVARGLHAVVAQRLVRKLCPACRKKTEAPAAMLKHAGIDPASVHYVYEESGGCDACGRTGFLGRTGIFEVWQPSAESRKLIAENAPADRLHAAALRDGMKSLQHSGLELALSGVTSLHEVARSIKSA